MEISELEFVRFLDTLSELGVEVPKAPESAGAPQPAPTPEVQKLQDMYKQVQSMTLPNHQKYSILASLECTIEALTVKPEYTSMTANALQNAVASKFPVKALCLDENYYTVGLDVMSQFLSATLSSKLKYIDDRFDCDNFASYVSSFMALEYGINAVGECFVGLVAYGDLFIKVLGLHACNLVVLPNDVKLYEPQLDRFLNGNVLELKDKQGRQVNIMYLPMQAVFG